jgi:hypothetical protein
MRQQKRSISLAFDIHMLGFCTRRLENNNPGLSQMFPLFLGDFSAPPKRFMQDICT